MSGNDTHNSVPKIRHQLKQYWFCLLHKEVQTIIEFRASQQRCSNNTEYTGWAKKKQATLKRCHS